MADRSPKAQGEEVKPEGRETIEEMPSETRFSFDLATTMRALYKDPSQKVKDESTEAHRVSWFVFKVNNTLLVTRVFMNKDLEKSQDWEARIVRIENGEVKTTGAERIRDITRMVEELEKSQRKTSLEEEIILLKQHRS